MSDKKIKTKRRFQKALTSMLENRTLTIAMQYCQSLKKNFDDMSAIEKLQVVTLAKQQAEKDLNFALQHGKELGENNGK